MYSGSVGLLYVAEFPTKTEGVIILAAPVRMGTGPGGQHYNEDYNKHSKISFIFSLFFVGATRAFAIFAVGLLELVGVLCQRLSPHKPQQN